MNKVKILIVEDEMIISANLKLNLLNNGYELVGQAVNFTEAIEIMESSPPDITLLDIQLSGNKNGIDIAKEINQRFKSPFIYLTSNTDSETVNEAKVTEPSAYLVKPFNKEELFTTIEIALYNFAKRKESAIDLTNLVIKDSLFIKKERHFIRLDFKDILFIKSDHIYLDIMMIDGKKHVVRGSLNEYINKLSGSFFRCHRSFIINTHYLSSVNHNELTLLNHTLPIGKKNREELITMLNIG